MTPAADDDSLQMDGSGDTLQCLTMDYTYLWSKHRLS